MKYHLGEIVKFGSKEFIVIISSVDGFLVFSEYKEKKERKMKLLNSKRSKYRLMALLLTMLVLTPLLMLTGCDSGCDGCIDIPKEVVTETITETVEVPVIVEVSPVLMVAEITNNSPYPYEPNKIKVTVANVSDITLYKFKLKVPGTNILNAYGDSVTHLGNGKISRGNLISPGQVLDLVLELNKSTVNTDISIEVL